MTLKCSKSFEHFDVFSIVDLQVNAGVSELIIGIYLHVFTNNEREISIAHKALPSAVLKISSSLLLNEYR